jgi:3-oxoadipate enol-lactonase
MPFADLHDVRLYFERAGSGPRVLLLNGTGTDLRNRPSPFEWPFASQVDLLAYDHRGLGRSEPADPDRQPTMADFGRDALALADHVGWDRFSALGISFGGMVAQELALLAGDRVERLVLACTSAGGAGGASYPLHDVYGMDPGDRADTMVGLMDTRTADDPELRGMFEQWMRGRPSEVPVGLRRQLEARRTHDTFDRLAGITAATLVAAGRYDGIAPLANSEALASRIPGARLAVFDGGHAFFVQDPAAWPAIASFLTGAGSPGRSPR